MAKEFAEQQTFFSDPATKKVLKLTLVDALFLNSLKNQHKSQIIEKIKETNPIDGLIRIACADDNFAKICKSSKLDEFWTELWGGYGIILSSILVPNSKPIIFHTHPEIKAFDLVRGTYFFLQSIKQKLETKTCFSLSELECLEEAIKYDSIHAIQRYNEYLYQQINMIDDNETIKHYFVKIISNCLKTVPEYGTYGYFMLAEAYGRFAIWLQKKDETSFAHITLLSAYECLTKADKIFEKSIYSVFDASLGQGLKRSNSFGCETVESARTMIADKFNNAMIQSPTSLTPSPKLTRAVLPESYHRGL